MKARCARHAVSRLEGEETVVQLQEHLEEHWGELNARYVRQAFATIRAAAFDPTHAVIVGMYRVETPLRDVVGGDIINPGELLVIMVYRSPAEKHHRRENGTSAGVAASAVPVHTVTWFHEHAHILLVTLSGDGGEVWILGCTEAGQGADD